MKKVMDTVIHDAIEANLPDAAVKRELVNLPEVKGKKVLIAIGKAAFRMAKAALETDVTFDDGMVITKYGHLEGELKGLRCFEAGHPVLDENTIKATDEAIKLVEPLKEDDLVVFLISGGGSALFESPLVPLSELEDINNQLLSSGANIIEINTIRKRLSDVKGGRFAKHCAPAQVYNIILSDVLGDPPDMIASGPTYPDTSTKEQLKEIVSKYDLKLSDKAKELCEAESVRELDNITTVISGSVTELCKSAAQTLEENGFKTTILSTSLSCEAREAGAFMASIADTYKDTKEKIAFLFGGETIVHLKGKGKGGRNQEIAFGAAKLIDGLDNVLIFSVGSDGTDGPTDAAGGFATGETMKLLADKEISYHQVLDANNTYDALCEIGQIIKTGPTGTNVNDLSAILIEPK